jgi:aminoglycoside 2''-phosphotransferase
LSTLPEYLARIEAITPGLDPSLARLNQEGMVNDVVAFDDGTAFRFPKADWAQRAMEREIRVLEVVRRHVTATVPDLRLHEGIGSYRWLPGEPMTREYLETLPRDTRHSLLEQVGTFLRELHSIPADEAGEIGTSDAVRTRDDWLTFYEKVRETIFPLLMGYQRTSVEALFQPIVDGTIELETQPVLIHGDLAPYHLLVDRATNRLSGVIDFGVAGLGDAATDISLLLYNYGEVLVQETGRAYPLDPALMSRSRFWAGMLELQWALTGLRNDDKSLLLAHIGSARGYNDPGVS